MRHFLLVSLAALALFPSAIQAQSPPVIWLETPTTSFVTQYPYIEIHSCSADYNLDRFSRVFKLNSVTVTGFNFAAATGASCSGDHRKSSTSTLSVPVGSNVLQAHICDDAGTPHCTDAGWTITRLAGPLPVVSLAPYSPDVQDYGRCANACFAATYAQGTVPYFSLDSPRSVGLVYNGDRVDLRPFVHVDVTHGGDSTNLPTAFRLSIKKADNSLIQFLNGEQVLRLAPSAGTATMRIGGQFDADSNGLSSTATNYVTVIVGAEYSGGIEEVESSTRVIIVNERNSSIARGWTLGGIQRLYSQSGGALITDGSGSAVFFASGYVTPAGVFGSLVSGIPGGGSGWTRLYPDSSRVVFNSAGYMTEARDRFGNATTITYDGNSRVSQIEDPLNNAITLAYGSYGLSGITDPASRVTAVTVDANHKLTAITDPDNVATSFGYDGSTRLSTITNRGGSTSRLGYDSNTGKLASVTGDSVEVVNANGSLSTDAPVVQYTAWQKVGVPYGSTSSPAAAPRADTVRARTTEPGGAVTVMRVNALGSPVEITNAVGQVVTATYDANGLPLRVVGPTGAVDSLAYSGNGVPTYARSGTGPITRVHYHPTWVTEADTVLIDTLSGSGMKTLRYLGTAGRLDSVKVAGHPATRLTFDSRGRVVTEQDSEHHLIALHSYAGTFGNHSRDSIPTARMTFYYQDGYGRDTAVKAPQVPLRRTHYDVLNRPTAQYDGVNANPTTMWFGATGLDSLGDPAGQHYRFAYNALGWVIRRTDPAGARDTSRYSRDGELRRWTNRRGQEVQYTYDTLHRRVHKGGTNVAAEGWSYSSNGRVVTDTSATSIETTYRDSLGQPDSVLTQIASKVFRRSYHYDRQGRRDSIGISGDTITFLGRRYNFDATGTPDGIVLGGATTTRSPNEDHLATQRAFPNGTSTTFDYNSIHGVSQITSSASYAAAVTVSASYDTLGRVAREVMGFASTGVGFTYDGLSRLVAESTVTNNSPPSSCDGNPPPIVDDYGNSCVTGSGWYGVSGTTFSYDAMGNRTDHSGSYSTGNRVTAFNGCTYATDADGNITSRTACADSARFYWSAESRLDSLTRLGARIAFRYDAAGRLVRRDSAGSAQRHFIWDGDDLLAELNVSATGKVAEYSYYSIDHLHALVIGATAYYAHQDSRGNTIALTDGSLRRDYAYDSWGALRSGTDYLRFNGADRARWKGALWMSPEADLYYMRNRWYEPTTGRFLSEDPIGLAGGINGYAFSSDDPVNGADPFGLCTIYKGNTNEIVREAGEGETVTAEDGRTLSCHNGNWEAGGGGSGGGRGGGGTRSTPTPPEPADGLSTECKADIAGTLVSLGLDVIGASLFRGVSTLGRGLAARNTAEVFAYGAGRFPGTATGMSLSIQAGLRGTRATRMVGQGIVQASLRPAAGLITASEDSSMPYSLARNLPYLGTVIRLGETLGQCLGEAL